MNQRQTNLDNITEEQLQKIKPLRTYEDEDLLVTELAVRFGWEAYRDYQNDLITTKEIILLLTCARKLENIQRYNNAEGVFIGTISAQAKDPLKTFNDLTSKLKGD